MSDILTRIAQKTILRVQAAKALVTLEEMKEIAIKTVEAKPKGFPFEKALAKKSLSLIAECKKASPSKGIIDPVYDHLKIALGYEKAGADCISVLTEPEWFMGSNEHLWEIAGAVSVPCLRKDFTVDEYMIYEAAVLGASAVLLICSLLDEKTLKHFISVAHSLGLSALVEAHDRDEISMALGAGARIIGVNNRNLRDFSVDLSNSVRLRKFVPAGVIFVAESGIKSPEDVAILRAAGVDAVLVGEAVIRDGGCVLIKAITQPPSLRVKFCGLTRPEDIEVVNRLRPDFVGFVFAADSRRRVTAVKAKELRGILDDGITVVGVFADDDAALVVKLLNDGVIDMAQLHGDEDDDYISFLKARTGGKPVIKAFKVRGPDTARRDIAAAAVSAADHILLDGSESGSGIAFDWKVIEGFRKRGFNKQREFFLAGGLDPSNVGAAVRVCRPFAVDVSSGVETDGVKDSVKMEEFMRAVRRAAGEAAREAAGEAAREAAGEAAGERRREKRRARRRARLPERLQERR